MHMAVSMRKQIAQNKRNTILTMVLFVALITIIGAIIAWANNNWIILAWFLIVTLSYVGIQFLISDIVALICCGARRAKRDEYQRLYKAAEKIVDSAKIPMPRLYIIKDPAPNAFTVGRNPSRACIAVTTGLLDVMDDKELRAIIAHEMVHIKNYDILTSTVTFGLVSIAGIIADFGLRTLLYSDRDEEDNSPIGMLFVLIVLALSPVLAPVVRFAISRRREYQADAASASFVGEASEISNALRQLEIHKQPMRQQNFAMEALFITNPLKKSIVSKIYSTHPPIESRIERLENVKK